MKVYITGADPASLKLEKIRASSVKVYRIDPRTGAKTDLEALPALADYTFSLPGGWEDAVLIFKK